MITNHGYFASTPKDSVVSRLVNEPPRQSTAVFVDESGRRSRVLMVTAVGSGVVVVALLLVVVAGVLGGTELPGLGWPGKSSGEPAVQATISRPTADPVTPRPGYAPPVTPSPTPQTPSSAPPPTRQTTTTDPPTGGSGRTPPASPAATVTDNPGHDGTPPGLVGKTNGPK
jgi:hypothetical protein